MGGVMVMQLLYDGISGHHEIGVLQLELVLPLRLPVDLLLQVLPKGSEQTVNQEFVATMLLQ